MNKLSPVFWLEEIIGYFTIILFLIVLFFYKIQIIAHNWLADIWNQTRRR